MPILSKATQYLTFLAIVFVSGIGVSESKTLYVERWGQNTDSCGSKSNPCQLISYALSQRAKRNDRIIVGPGFYLDNITVGTNDLGEPLSGLKIESAGGRNVTIVEAAESDSSVFEVRQPNVRIGKKGKGFSVTGAIIGVNSGIEFADAIADRGKVEGNLSFENANGFKLAGDKIQVRHNIARENDAEGFICNGCTNARIQDNQAIFNGLDGFRVSSSAKIAMQKNRSVRNDSMGYRVITGGDPEAAASIEKFLHNLAFDNGAGGFRMDRPEKVTFTGNIATLNTSDGLRFRNNTGVSVNASRITNNVSAINGGSGIVLSSTSESVVIGDVRLEGNHAVDNNGDGIQIYSGIQFSSSKNNNTYNNVSGCGISNEDEVDATFLRHFMSVTGTPNDVCNEGTGVVVVQLADTPSPVRITAAKPL